MKTIALKVLSTISILWMIFINILAVVLPLNGLSTKQISDSYPVFFVPAGYVFSIWSIIYILLIIFCIAQLREKDDSSQSSSQNLRKIQIPIIISSLANGLWIIAWHNLNVPVSMILMLILLVSLIYIYTNLKFAKRIFRIPFSVYLGWVSVATIANLTIFLYTIGFDGFGIRGEIWAALLIIIASILGSIVIIRKNDKYFPLVILWAIIGIQVNFKNSNEIGVAVFVGVLIVLLSLLFKFKVRK